MVVECFVALGGNQPPSLERMRQAVKHLEQIGSSLSLSRLYLTSPVSPLPQPPFFNAVCRLKTSLPLAVLWRHLQEIEKSMGKKPKPKSAPRVLDLDLLFYGSFVGRLDDLEIPHPRWQERLFVLAPLAELIARAPSPPHPLLSSLIATCCGETVIPLQEKLT